MLKCMVNFSIIGRFMTKTQKNIIPASPSAKDYKAGDYAYDEPRDLSWTIAKDPIALFEDWLEAAKTTEINDPNAVALATVDEDGLPDVRMVLLKGVDARGFVFYSNGNSAKGEQLQIHSKAAMCFHWKSQRRQIRLRGDVVAVTEAESDAYWNSRARHSRIGARASDQSQRVKDRDALVAQVKAVEAAFEGQEVTRPAHWYGWRIIPKSIEFWQDGAYRIHDRICFTQTENGWTQHRLFP